MKVLIHIYNVYNEIRGGYLSPVLQAYNYDKYEPMFIYTHENVASEIAIEKGIKAHFIKHDNYKDFFETLRLKKISIKGIMSYFVHTYKLVKLIKTEDIKIIHVQNFESLILCYVASKLTGVKIINHVRGDADFSRVRSIFVKSDYLIAVSNKLRESILNYFRGKKRRKIDKKFYVVENGVELPENIDKSCSDPIQIVMIGSIYKVKGQYEFIRDVWPLVRETSDRNIVLNIIGPITDSDYFDDIIKLIEENNYSDINIVGMQKDMHLWYSKAHITVIYSTFEGLPRVALESMSYGIPVVATNITGNNDLVQDGITGFLIERNNNKHAAECILRLINDDKLREKIGFNARKEIENKYYIKKSAIEIEKIYDEILNNK
jgi:glycosyltransferase involved in cell wall biosynthesis